MPDFIHFFTDRIALQTRNAERVLKSAGWQTPSDTTHRVLGDPQDVLSIRGNVADIALTNHLWLLDILASGISGFTLPPELNTERPSDHEAALTFVDRREHMTADEAHDYLTRVNGTLVTVLKSLTNHDLTHPVEATFYGREPLYELLFDLLSHGDRHLGQAWAVIKAEQKQRS